MIHPIQTKYGTQYVISSDQVALPGCYNSERAARYAFHFPNHVLQQLQDEVNEREPDFDKRYITFEMLQETAKRNGKKLEKEVP